MFVFGGKKRKIVVTMLMVCLVNFLLMFSVMFWKYSLIVVDLKLFET